MLRAGRGRALATWRVPWKLACLIWLWPYGIVAFILERWQKISLLPLPICHEVGSADSLLYEAVQHV